MQRNFLAGTALGLAICVGAPASAGAADPHSVSTPTGQPTQSCQSEPSAPGGTSHGLNQPQFLNTATHVYAGAGHSTISGNDKAVSQYDVACFEVSQPH
jgi:hypothetical protein